MILTGDWEGYYLDPESDDEPFPIQAQFEVSGNRLSGSMKDLRPTWDMSVEKILKGVPPDSPDRATWEQIANEYPDGAIRTNLPIDSQLKGFIRERSLTFRKDYCGPEVSIWISKGLQKEAPQLHNNLYIEYSGEVDESGHTIVGKWNVYEGSFFGLQKKLIRSGDFRLDMIGKE